MWPLKKIEKLSPFLPVELEIQGSGKKRHEIQVWEKVGESAYNS